MLYPIEITNPFRKGYGAKITFKIPQEAEFVKSVIVGIPNFNTYIEYARQQQLDSTSSQFPMNFDVYELSMLLNNANDNVIVDARGKQYLFANFTDWTLGINDKGKNYRSQEIIVNKSLIKNAQHTIIMKMPQELIDYIKASGDSAMPEYIKALKFIIYINAE